MAEKNKGVVQMVLEKQKKDGSPFCLVYIDDTEYYDSKSAFKDKKGQEIEFEWSLSSDGKLKFINPVGSGFKGWGSRGKSPEELALQRKSFAVAYAKDLTVATITGSIHLLKELPEGIKYFEFLGLMREAATKMTKDSTTEILKLLE